MRIIHSIIALTVAALILTACGGASQPAGGMAIEAPAPQAPMASDSYAEMEAGLEARPAGAPAQAQSQQPPGQRLVIKSANITVQVERVAEVEAILRARAEQLGGYVVSVQTSGSDAAMTSVITFRVPAERFDEALSGVEGLAHRVLSRGVSGDDVTEEFVDLSSRLRNLEATRDRLLELLARADQVDDALQVNQALSDVQGQIEQIQGRMKYLRESAAFSTISAELRPVPATPSIINEDSWQPLLVAREALSGLVSFGQSLASLAIVLLVWSPVWLTLLLAGRWGLRQIRARRSSRIPPAPPAAPVGK
jgi:hypothetical protein